MGISLLPVFSVFLLFLFICSLPFSFLSSRFLPLFSWVACILFFYRSFRIIFRIPLSFSSLFPSLPPPPPSPLSLCNLFVLLVFKTRRSCFCSLCNYSKACHNTTLHVHMYLFPLVTFHGETETERERERKEGKGRQREREWNLSACE